MNSNAVNALISSGADAHKNLYSLEIFFPGENQTLGENVTVRASGFNPPPLATGTYEKKLHGVTIKYPKPEQIFERKFSITITCDANWDLYEKLKIWLSSIVDSTSGGVSNFAYMQGKCKVMALSGNVLAPTLSGQIDSKGSIIKEDETSPTWWFANVWPEKVGEPEFSTGSSDSITFTVDFNFGDCQYPSMNGASLNSESPLNKTFGIADNLI